jgi:putative ABC transport system permease protein
VPHLRDVRSGMRSRRRSVGVAVVTAAVCIGALVGLPHVNASARTSVLDRLDAVGADVAVVAAAREDVDVILPGAVARAANLQEVTSAMQLSVAPGVPVHPSRLSPPLASKVPVVGIQTHGVVAGLRVIEGEDRRHPHLPFALIGRDGASSLGIHALPAAVEAAGHEWLITGVVQGDPLLPEVSGGLLAHPDVVRFRYGELSTSLVVRARAMPDGAMLREAANPARPGLLVVSRPAALQQARSSTESALSDLLMVILGVLLAVGTLVITAVVVNDVRSRTSEIGLRRCLGATDADIVALVVAHSLLLVAIGTVVGICGGILGAVAWAHHHQWPFQLAPGVIATAAAAGIGVGLSASLLPATLALRVDPALAVAAEE